ncbi:DNA repair protein Rad52 [Sulfurimonas sp. SAG-AH-194-I05]|nr:Rad52/Rad22 family DNA repair protein [Sulfurimonas sp. SAG-AH-194-I05]MDF1875799.1 DNA repair protein Rad52 [Sulfurimonas sp. SAG-AH-194-I05]
MFFNDRQQKLLSYPLDGSRVKTLEKAGRKFSYLPTFDIINTLNLIFGYDGWETQVKRLDMISSTTNQNGNFVVTFSAIVRLKVWDTAHKHYIVREDNGVSVSVAKSLGEAMETASKASVSDGIKRSAKSFGNSLGNPLYDPQQRDVDYTNSNQIRGSQQQMQEPQQIQHQPQTNTNYDLASLGLVVVEQNGELIVTGGDTFTYKAEIKNAGYFWNGNSRKWSKPINSQVAA